MSLYLAVVSSKHFIETDSNWITFVNLIILILLTLLFSLYRKKSFLIVQSLFSPRHYSQLIREGKLYTERFFLIHSAVIFLIQTLLCYLLLKHFFPALSYSKNSYILYFIILAVIIAYYLFKQVVTSVFTYLFEFIEVRYDYWLYKLLYLSVNSAIAYLLILLAVYTGYMQILYLYIPIFLVVYLFISFKLFALISKKINPFHFFIYFCTFEILPCFLLVKFLFILENRV